VARCSYAVALSGFLTKRTGTFSQHKRRFFVLREGTLLWYKTERDVTPTGFCHLSEAASICEHPRPSQPRRATSKEALNAPPAQGAPLSPPSSQKAAADELDSASSLASSVEPPLVRTSSEHARGAALAIHARKDYVLWADDSSERDKWLRALRHNATFPPLPGLAPPTPSGGTAMGKETKEKHSLLSSLVLGAEKKMIGRAVTTDLGKKLLREYCLPETFSVLQAMRDMASLDPAMPPRYGAFIEDTMLKMAVKVMLLYQHGRIGTRDFDAAVSLVDRLAVDLVAKYDATITPPDYCDLRDPEHRQLATVFTAINAELKLLLKDHMSEKNLSALSQVVSYLGSPASMSRFTGEPACFEELGKMVAGLRKMYQLDGT